MPGKNIRTLGDKPLIAFSIEAALESGSFERVVVSTDSEEIADIASAYGAEVPFMRSAELSDHYTPVSEATADALAQLDPSGERYTVVAQLMANCPFREAEDVSASGVRFLSSGRIPKISVVEFGWTNPWWALKLGEGDRLTPVFEEAMTSRSQDLPTLYAPTGAIWWARAECCARAEPSTFLDARDVRSLGITRSTSIRRRIGEWPSSYIKSAKRRLSEQRLGKWHVCTLSICLRRASTFFSEAERMHLDRLAVYTTLYPAALPYWDDCLSSIKEQSDANFDLWIGVDGLDPAVVARDASAALEREVLVRAPDGDPAEVRASALSEIAERYPVVVLVDSDDMMMPSRVAAARPLMKNADGAGCALELSDERGGLLDCVMRPPEGLDPVTVLPYVNAFGFSNTVYHTDLLRRCLSDVRGVTLLDWFVATRAWLFGARLTYDVTPRMQYRQYGANTAGVVGTFSPERRQADQKRVLTHYAAVLSSTLEGAIPERVRAVERAQKEVDSLYIGDLPWMPPGGPEVAPLWWEWVTAPLLPFPSSG